MNDIIYQVLLKDLTPNERANLSFKIQKQKILENHNKIKEMQKMKEEITQEVLESISVNIENKIRQALDELFINNNI